MKSTWTDRSDAAKPKSGGFESNDSVRFAAALDTTHAYLQAMGAKVAPSKGYNFASTKDGRKWLKETWWEHIADHIEVVDDFRYLGVRLSTQMARKDTQGHGTT